MVWLAVFVLVLALVATAIINKLSQKSADFVICNKDFSVLAVIELDDSTHDRVERRQADVDKNAALNAAGIRVIRWSVRSMPDVQSIQKAIAHQQ